MNPFHHAQSSAARYGGRADDYLPVHRWFDESKAFFPDIRHRALRHHAEGIFLAERLFGPTITTSTGRLIPTRFIGEQHVLEDLGRIPTVQDWLECMAPEPWMMKVGKLMHEAKEDEQGTSETCECEGPGFFHSGVPGILAHMRRGRLGTGSAVERCDLCERYPTDETARAKLVELGLA